jgi:aryl-alcohol dehydrogenase-like predicted oxidoreductase
MRTFAICKGLAGVVEIGQGTKGVGGFFGRAQDNDTQFIGLLKLELDLCITFNDTAVVYGDGRAEVLVAKAVAGIRHNGYILNKFSAQNRIAVAQI